MKTNEIGPVGQGFCANAGLQKRRSRRTASDVDLKLGELFSGRALELGRADFRAKLTRTLEV